MLIFLIIGQTSCPYCGQLNPSVILSTDATNFPKVSKLFEDQTDLLEKLLNANNLREYQLKIFIEDTMKRVSINKSSNKILNNFNQ